MKNIHLIPTGKPSRLFKDDFGKLIYSINIDQEQNHFEPQHLFITSDEEIKEGDWFITKTNDVLKVQKPEKSYDPIGEKIILTTDQDLIKDGVQAIDDEFLEWFCKNSSCERVETHIVELCTNCGQQYCDNRDCRGYNDEPEYLISYPENTTQKIITYCEGYEVNTEKIIIPKEEPKQETLKEAAEIDLTKLCYYDKRNPDFQIKEEYGYDKEEIEATGNFAKKDCACDNCFYGRSTLTEQLVWQQERMYSAEDMQEYAKFCIRCYNKGLPCIIAKDWFEQFKK